MKISNIKYPIQQVQGKQILNIKLLGIGYLFLIFCLFLYSFTQIDLGLTLTKISIWQSVQTFFQNIGYFNRPLSTFLYLLIILLLYSFYILLLIFAKKQKINRKQIKLIIISLSVILTFSYNAFSYDLFNYIFDAKIVTYYNQNPYNFKALDFPNDPMLSFMHWTHRTLPYGPIWLFLTVPLSYAGFQYFLLTFFLFKGLATFAYLGSVFLVSKISKILKKEDEIFNIVFFALNPLVLIEGLVSAHNDMVVIFFSLLSIYFLINKKYIRSFFILLISIGVKFSSTFLVPLYLFSFYQKIKNKNLNWDKFFLFATILMIIPIILASFRTNFQPWYLLNIIPFASFLAKKYYILIPTTVISLFSLFHYIPFLYLGNWDKPIPTILFGLTSSSIVLSLLLTSLYFFKKYRSNLADKIS